ncbi:predicted protein [Histoplasma capsulatum H143]|uniref:Myb-like domain-containing protein n=1 Tax=Ajellomyces capsulatus (strain H143) TaxID=544712 RepID=C6HID1_AJECH|nr:predicted protein [Histoplasma capsulatum H143]
MAAKLLEILQGSAVTPPAAMDQWTAVDNPQLSPDDETRGLVRKKKARWTRKDDERLGSLGARNWCWWEIKQQFPHWTVAALQQRGGGCAITFGHCGFRQVALWRLSTAQEPSVLLKLPNTATDATN